MLALPWQTRWIFSTGTAGGFPWEQGTVAVYASWGVLSLAIVAGLISERSGRQATPKSLFPVAVFSVLFVISLFTSSRIATGLWWTHVILLALFVWIVVRRGVGATTFARWFVLALVPHAALGVWQFARQDIIGSTLLGIATQHPWVSGVSVVEHGLYRALRAYGGFPHPNIFGGWLAVGLALSPALARRSRSNAETLGLAACAALFSLALVLTFSRGAWAAAVLGIGLACWTALARNPPKPSRQAVWLVMIAVLVIAAAGAISQWDHVRARFTPELRLERWSLEQRKTSLEEGLQAWLRRPVAGWGPGASLVAVTALRSADSSARQTATFEPPHAVPLVVLVETGALGFFALLSLIAWAASATIRRQRLMSALPIFAVLTVIALSDHFLWTLWAGQALFMFTATLVILTALKIEPRPS